MQPAPAIVFLLQSTRSAIPSRPQAPTTWSWLSLDCCLKTISTNPVQEKLSRPSSTRQARSARENFGSPSKATIHFAANLFKILPDKILLAHDCGRAFSKAVATAAQLHHVGNEIQDAHCCIHWIRASRMDVRDQVSVRIRVS